MNDIDLKEGMRFKIPSAPNIREFGIFNIRKEKKSLLQMETFVLNIFSPETMSDGSNVLSVEQAKNLIKKGHWKIT